MDAKELYEVVKNVPQNLWPHGLTTLVLAGGTRRFYVGNRNSIEAEDAALMFEGKMTHYLLDHGYFPIKSGEVHAYSVVQDVSHCTQWFRTLIEALAWKTRQIAGREGE